MLRGLISWWQWNDITLSNLITFTLSLCSLSLYPETFNSSNEPVGGELVTTEFGRGELRLGDVRAGIQETETSTGMWRRGVWGPEAVRRKRRAELSSLQSSLNCSNRICYCCNGRHKEKQKMRRSFLEVVRSARVCSHSRQIWGQPDLPPAENPRPARLSAEPRTEPSLHLSPRSRRNILQIKGQFELALEQKNKWRVMSGHRGDSRSNISGPRLRVCRPGAVLVRGGSKQAESDERL